MRWWCLSMVVCLGFFPSVARADDTADAKNFFKAGAAAYTAGDYLAAIQALDAAYRVTPLPAIAFSLAQAERRQYFVSRETSHLARAVELYRVYLKQVPSGGRRADAADALAQLEPLAVGLSTTPAGEIASARGSDSAKTRLMVSSEAPGAAISLDGGPPVASPLIAEVTPGTHSVGIAATGFLTSERRVVAIAGELVPVEVELKERPAVVIVEPSNEAELYVDGSYSGKVKKGARVELPGGLHQFAFARKGRRLEAMVVTLERGSTTHLPVELHWTGQRMAAISLLVVSGATLVGGLVQAGLAADQEHEAQEILDRRDQKAIGPAELRDYESSVDQRNRLRIGAIASLAVSAASLVTGAFLHELDEPNVRDVFPRGSQPKVRVEASYSPSSRALDVAARLTF